MATAFVHDSGDQSEAAGELVSVRGTDATIERADFWATLLVVREAGVKAAALLRPAIKRAVDNLILTYIYCLKLLATRVENVGGMGIVFYLLRLDFV